MSLQDGKQENIQRIILTLFLRPGGTLDKTPSISSKPLTLRPPNFNRIMYSSFSTSMHMINTMSLIRRHYDARLSNLLAESKFPSKYTLNEKYLDSKVFDKIKKLANI